MLRHRETAKKLEDNLRALVTKCREQRIIPSPDKFQFRVYMTLEGFKIDSSNEDTRIQPDKKKVNQLTKFLKPNSQK